MSDELLDTLLSAANELTEETLPKKQLKEVDIFKTNTQDDTPKKLKSSSAIHNGDTDSSDDEDNKYYEERKYNECGRDIKHLLTTTSSVSDNLSPTPSPTPPSSITWKSKPNTPQLAVKENVITKKQNGSFDPIFGLKIVNPLVSFTTLQDRMVGREAIMFSQIKKFVIGNISDRNWVIGGVIVGKSAVKTSQKGNQFMIWTLSDLKDDIKTVSVFLFSSAYKQLWKTATGAVVGILNPTVLDKKDSSKDEACLSVDNAQKVMILGQSKDLGTCKSVKKNGEPCKAVVNMSRCEYCIYHVKEEYQKCAKRSELQSNFTGKGLTALRNKVLGKNEVFYAGKSYTAIPAKRSTKLEKKDNLVLESLSGSNVIVSGPVKKMPKKGSKSASNLEVSQRQRLRDISLIEKLSGNDVKTSFSASHSAEVTLESSKKNVADVIAKLKATTAEKKNYDSSLKTVEANSTANVNSSTEKITTNKIDKPAASSQLTVMGIPMLKGFEKGTIDLGTNVTSQQVNRAKLNALKYIQRNGPLKRSDPNSIKKSGQSKKRALENFDNHDNSKRAKIIENEFLSDRFKKMMETTSKHMDLLDQRDDEEQEKYFHKLEMKEQMEEKMINTYKVPCKAVRCLQCKYTNFSASQFCKDNKHQLKVFDAVKRFFKCGNCGNRTTSLEIVPTVSCKNCGSGKWERTGMMKEKTAEVAHTLSIRGGEQKFVNSVISDSNLNLLVPDE